MAREKVLTEMRRDGAKIISVGKKHPGDHVFEMYAIEVAPMPRQVVERLPNGRVRVTCV
jgi:hypothetical protein